MRRAACNVLLIAAFVLATFVGSSLLVLSRSEVVDDAVGRIAGVVVPLVPRGWLGSFVTHPACVEYPAIERLPLRGWVDVSNGDEVSPVVIWWRNSSSLDLTVPLFLLMVLMAAAHSLLAVWWAWPNVRLGVKKAPGRLAELMLATGAWSAPAAALCLSLYWPLVSLWGTVAYAAVDRYGVNAWVWDTTPTRVMVGAGLLVCFSSASLAVARRRINVMLRGGALAGVDRALAEGVCLECGYAVHGSPACCPECGRTLAPVRFVAFIWPRVLGTPTKAKRVRLRIGFIAAAVGLLAAPLLVGTVRVLVGAM